MSYVNEETIHERESAVHSPEELAPSFTRRISPKERKRCYPMGCSAAAYLRHGKGRRHSLLLLPWNLDDLRASESSYEAKLIKPDQKYHHGGPRAGYIDDTINVRNRSFELLFAFDKEDTVFLGSREAARPASMFLLLFSIKEWPIWW